ncbi:fatty acid desaturase [Altericroceibacterium xinjiangense]|uniref:fatty acid desaturase n=1 Tax=Altericroceibacterium xinjiangense TaxID=762261 RepID=UPI000F7F52E2|nr:fatty acid desaturase [Altericroceibacterium xinjiangense]
MLREASKYRQPAPGRSAMELAVTAIPFVLLWALTWLTLDAGYWLGLLFAIPAGGFLLRLFLIQHDCGHGAFFSRRKSNDWVGRILGVVTLTPYAYWRHCHAIHHAGTGNLDNRGVGDVDTITVEEFRSYTRTKQFLYRLYRHPVVLFGLGPAYLFLLRHRLPVGMMRRGWSPWISTLGTNLGMAAVYAALIYLVGLKMFLLVHLPIVLVAASAGVWLFYVQHQFEHTRWEREADWSFHEAALHGSSNYQLPGILRWFTANVGLHHVHHLVSRIPFYRLPEVTRDIPALATMSQVTLRDSLGTVRLVLWDEEKRRLVSFRDAAS